YRTVSFEPNGLVHLRSRCGGRHSAIDALRRRSGLLDALRERGSFDQVSDGATERVETVPGRDDVPESVCSARCFRRRCYHLAQAFGVFPSVILVFHWPARILGDQLPNTANPDRGHDRDTVSPSLEKHVWQPIVNTGVEHRTEPLDRQIRELLVSTAPI